MLGRLACAAAFLPIMTSACTHTEVRQRSPVDMEEKTIAVPPAKRGLLKGIAEALAAAGWKVSVDQTLVAPPRQKSNAAISKEVKKIEPKKVSSPSAVNRTVIKARYRLEASFREIDYCRRGRIVIYDLTITDSRSGAKVIEQGGRECDRDIVQKFKDTLAGIK